MPDRQQPKAGRCTYRKHVVENEAMFCDCGNVILGKTAAGNAAVVTVLNVTLAEDFGYRVTDEKEAVDA